MGDAGVVMAGMPAEQLDRLVAGLKEADPSACGELYDRFAHRLYHFVTSRLPGDAPLAEEVVLLTLAYAVRNIGAFDPRRATLSAWLYGIARRHTQRELRLRARRKSIPASAQVPLDSLPEQTTQEDVAAAVAARLRAQQTVAELRRCLRGIEMEALLLHCVHQLSAKEIGQVLGRSERAIDSLLLRARQKARERLQDDEC